MALVILNISTDLFERIRKYGFHGKYDDELETINAFCEGKILSDDASNGDVIKTLFPNKQFVSIASSRIYDFTTDNKIDCDLDWWNSPYKGE